jgi:hypothetical protein
MTSSQDARDQLPHVRTKGLLHALRVQTVTDRCVLTEKSSDAKEMVTESVAETSAEVIPYIYLLVAISRLFRKPTRMVDRKKEQSIQNVVSSECDTGCGHFSVGT